MPDAPLAGRSCRPCPGRPGGGGRSGGGAGAAPGPRGGRTRARGGRAAHLPEPAGDAGPRSPLAGTARPDPPPPEPASSGRNRARWPELSPPRRQRRASLQLRGRRDPRVAFLPPPPRRHLRGEAGALATRGGGAGLGSGREAGPRGGGGALGPEAEEAGTHCGAVWRVQKVEKSLILFPFLGLSSRGLYGAFCLSADCLCGTPCSHAPTESFPFSLHLALGSLPVPPSLPPFSPCPRSRKRKNNKTKQKKILSPFFRLRGAHVREQQKYNYFVKSQ